jgi:hypothetical protein
MMLFWGMPGRISRAGRQETYAAPVRNPSLRRSYAKRQPTSPAPYAFSLQTRTKPSV